MSQRLHVQGITGPAVAEFTYLDRGNNEAESRLAQCDCKTILAHMEPSPFAPVKAARAMKNLYSSSGRIAFRGGFSLSSPPCPPTTKWRYFGRGLGADHSQSNEGSPRLLAHRPCPPAQPQLDKIRADHQLRRPMDKSPGRSPLGLNFLDGLFAFKRLSGSEQCLPIREVMPGHHRRGWEDSDIDRGMGIGLARDEPTAHYCRDHSAID